MWLLLKPGQRDPASPLSASKTGSEPEAGLSPDRFLPISSGPDQWSGSTGGGSGGKSGIWNVETSDIITGTKVNEGEIGRGRSLMDRGGASWHMGLGHIGKGAEPRIEQVLSSAGEKQKGYRTGPSEPSEPSGLADGSDRVQVNEVNQNQKTH